MSSAPESPATTHEEEALDPADIAWRQRRSAVAPLAFGVIGLALSPLLLGLIVGPLGMRAGIDLWRTGTRRPTVVAGITASFLAIVVSVISALLWGSVLATVLLGRDAMREAERWRGRTVEASSVESVDATGPHPLTLAVPEGRERLLLVAFSTGSPVSAELLAAIATAMPEHPDCAVVLIDPLVAADQARGFALAAGLDAPTIGTGATLPAPLDAISAFPTLVVIDRGQRIVCAVVGSRRGEELSRLLHGTTDDEAKGR